MKTSIFQKLSALIFVLFTLLLSGIGQARADDTVFIGLKIKAGGRYDDVRMCVASPKGSKGGPAMDVTFYAELPVADKLSIGIDIPVFRPVMFGAAFEMLQFEPEVSFLFRVSQGDKRDVVIGPTLGGSFHYGPDYRSGRSGDERGSSFFAAGPRIGAVVALDFKRPEKAFDFQLGLNPYVTPMLSGDGDDTYKGIVVGGSLDGTFKFAP